MPSTKIRNITLSWGYPTWSPTFEVPIDPVVVYRDKRDHGLSFRVDYSSKTGGKNNSHNDRLMKAHLSLLQDGIKPTALTVRLRSRLGATLITPSYRALEKAGCLYQSENAGGLNQPIYAPHPLAWAHYDLTPPVWPGNSLALTEASPVERRVWQLSKHFFDLFHFVPQAHDIIKVLPVTRSQCCRLLKNLEEAGALPFRVQQVPGGRKRKIVAASKRSNDPAVPSALCANAELDRHFG